ncbi:MAG: cohesin domain-containing protein [Candidatus Methanoperedens sp.]|nr:cohesin domain-containing protein [Candidatus Methanoperedens sp.]
MIGTSNAAHVTVLPADQNVATGESFNLNVTIDPEGVSIAGAQLNVAYNQSVLNVNSVAEGNLFTQNGASTFFNNGTINNSIGTVINIFDAIIGRKNISTSGVFLTINFTVVGSSGGSNITLSNVKISDPDGLPVLLNTSNGSVTINSPPVLNAIGDQNIDEAQTLTITLSSTDADGDILDYSASNLPSGAQFNTSTRIFQWTPGYTQSGTYPSVHFEVSDGNLTDSENISITVNNVNRPPTFTAIPSNESIFNETDTITISISASDPDSDPLTYSIKIDGIEMSTSTTYDWVTNNSSSGNHVINISVNDGTEIVSETIMVYINNYYPRYDINQDGVVDIGDLTVIGQYFNEDVTHPYPRYDVNMDGKVNIMDIVLAAGHYGEYT